jgi:lysophospholipase L1-like esterase
MFRRNLKIKHQGLIRLTRGPGPFWFFLLVLLVTFSLFFGDRDETAAVIIRVLPLWFVFLLLTRAAIRLAHRYLPESCAAKLSFERKTGNGRTQLFVMLLFAVAAAIAPLVFNFDGRLVARHFFRILLVWAVLAPVFYAGALLRHWRQALLAVASLALCLAILAWAGPFILGNFVVPDYHLDVDHRPQPNGFESNEDAIWPKAAASTYSAESFNIVFLGDSFTWGSGVGLAKAFPALVRNLLQKARPALKLRVLNFGWVSSGPVTQLRQLREIGAKYHPRLIVQAFDMTDFDDDLHAAASLREIEEGIKQRPGAKSGSVVGRLTIFRAMLLRLGFAIGVADFPVWMLNGLAFEVPDSWRTRVSALRRSGRPISPANPGGAQYWFMFQPLEASEPYFQTSWKAIEQTAALARQWGAGYVLFILPRYQQYNRRESPADPKKSQVPADDRYLFEVFRWFEKQAATVAFPIHSLLPDFRNSGAFPTVGYDDFHFNETGHAIAAGAIVRHLLEDGLIPTESN